MISFKRFGPARITCSITSPCLNSPQLARASCLCFHHFLCMCVLCVARTTSNPQGLAINIPLFFLTSRSALSEQEKSSLHCCCYFALMLLIISCFGCKSTSVDRATQMLGRCFSGIKLKWKRKSALKLNLHDLTWIKAIVVTVYSRLVSLCQKLELK